VSRRVPARAAFVALLLAWPAGAARRPEHGGELRLIAGPARAPAFAWSDSEVRSAALVHETLYRVGPDGRAWPLLAAAMPGVDETGLVVRIPLIQGLVFHDGEPLGARAAARALRHLQSERGSPHRWLVDGIASVRGEGTELVLELSRPTPDLALRLSALPTAIARQTKGGVVGCGPFAPRGKGTLTPFSRHPEGAPYLDRVRVVASSLASEEAHRFALGQLDVSTQAPPEGGGASRHLDGPWSARLLLLVRDRALAPQLGRALRPETLVRFVPAPARPARSEPSTAGGAWPSRELRLLVRDAPHLRSLAESLVLSLSAAGARVSLRPRRSEAFLGEVVGGHGDVVLVERPTVVGSEELVREQLAALAGDGVVVPLVLRSPRMYLRPGWHGLRFDPAGFPRFDDLWRGGPP